MGILRIAVLMVDDAIVGGSGNVVAGAGATGDSTFFFAVG